MRHISKDQMIILERRLIFLERRLKERGKYKGDSYDKNEIAALKTAIWYLKFVDTHPSIQHRIAEQSSLEEIYELSNEMEEL